MTNLRLALAAALLTGAALPAFAADTQPATDAAAATTSQMPAQNNAQAGQSDMGNNAAPNMQAQSSAGSQTAMNSADGSMGISSAASPTQRKGTLLSAAQRAKADAAEAETTRQLNEEAAAMAAPNRTAMR